MTLSQYIHSLSIITFDLNLGQKTQQTYPSIPIPCDTPYLSFPDSNAAPGPCLGFHFRVPAWWRDYEDRKDENVEKDESATETASKASHRKQPLYGHVFFLQKPSPHISRGFIMKSLVLLTPLPFINLFQKIIQIVGEMYFREMSEMDVINEVHWDGLQRVYEDSLQWPLIRTWHEMEDRILKVQCLGKNVRYRVPLMSWADEWALHETRHMKRAARSCNHVDQLSNDSQQSQQQARRAISSQNLTTKSSLLRRTIDLKYDDTTGEVLHATSLTPLKERLRGRRFIFQREVNIYKTFRNQLDQLVRLWELVMVGEPILVLSPSPTQCCEAVLSLVSLIAPIFYGGDFRPYFTVHNVEYKTFASMGERTGFESVILGVTNPFFVKSYEAWPNILAVGTDEEYNTRDEIRMSGDSSPSSSSSLPTASVEQLRKLSTNAFSFVSGMVRKGRGSQSTVRSTDDSRKKLMWEYEECLWSRRKFVTKQDQSWQSKLVNLDSLNRGSLDNSATLLGNDNQILTFFEQLTNDFLFPLQQCFDKLLYSMKTFIIRSEHKKIMRPETFCAYIAKHGYRPEIFSASQERVQEMYTKFIHSKNFQSWLDDRCKQEYLNEVLHCNIGDVIGKFTEVGIVDLFLRLRDDIQEQKASGIYEEEIMERLKSFLRELVQHMPESLKESLERSLIEEGDDNEEQSIRDTV